MDNNGDKLIILRDFQDNFTAHLALTILQDNDIPAQLLGSEWDGPLGVPMAGFQNGIRLMIFERDAEQARQLLKNLPDE